MILFNKNIFDFDLVLYFRPSSEFVFGILLHIFLSKKLSGILHPVSFVKINASQLIISNFFLNIRVRIKSHFSLLC